VKPRSGSAGLLGCRRAAGGVLSPQPFRVILQGRGPSGNPVTLCIRAVNLRRLLDRIMDRSSGSILQPGGPLSGILWWSGDRADQRLLIGDGIRSGPETFWMSKTQELTKTSSSTLQVFFLADMFCLCPAGRQPDRRPGVTG
jgi:hypothetical protein